MARARGQRPRRPGNRHLRHACSPISLSLPLSRGTRRSWRWDRFGRREHVIRDALRPTCAPAVGNHSSCTEADAPDNTCCWSCDPLEVLFFAELTLTMLTPVGTIAE
eukprot:5269269-Pyramimonas_sp.AAC.1